MRSRQGRDENIPYCFRIENILTVSCERNAGKPVPYTAVYMTPLGSEWLPFFLGRDG